MHLFSLFHFHIRCYYCYTNVSNVRANVSNKGADANPIANTVIVANGGANECLGRDEGNI